MSYSVQTFNQYKAIVDNSCSAVARSIMFLLKPTMGYPRHSEDVIKEYYKTWQSDCRAMDAACQQTWHSSTQDEMIKIPQDDEEHKPCRMMAAVIIERTIYDEHIAGENLVEAVDLIRANLDTCARHPSTCACHHTEGWTYANDTLVRLLVKDLSKKQHDTTKCACGACHNTRVLNGTSDAYLADCIAETNKYLCNYNKPLSTIASLLDSGKKADDAISEARQMPGGESDSGFIKNLFLTVQGVKYDDKCPHDLPFYACMSCSH
jgi:hypothetical protein